MNDHQLPETGSRLPTLKNYPSLFPLILKLWTLTNSTGIIKRLVLEDFSIKTGQNDVQGASKEHSLATSIFLNYLRLL